MHTSSQVGFFFIWSLHQFKKKIDSSQCEVHIRWICFPSFSFLKLTLHMSTQDICSTEPLAHVDFYPNGGLSQVLSNCSSKWWWLLIIIDELIVIDEYWRFWSQVCGVGSCSCSSGASVCGSCYHGLAIDNDILYKRWWFWWWWYQESPWSKCQNHNHDEDNDHSITMMWNIRKTPMHRRLGLGRKSRQGSWTL